MVMMIEIKNVRVVWLWLCDVVEGNGNGDRFYVMICSMDEPYGCVVVGILRPLAMP
jgi:hypothetical protein